MIKQAVLFSVGIASTAFITGTISLGIFATPAIAQIPDYGLDEQQFLRKYTCASLSRGEDIEKIATVVGEVVRMTHPVWESSNVGSQNKLRAISTTIVGVLIDAMNDCPNQVNEGTMMYIGTLLNQLEQL